MYSNASGFRPQKSLEPVVSSMILSVSVPIILLLLALLLDVLYKKYGQNCKEIKCQA